RTSSETAADFAADPWRRYRRDRIHSPQDCRVARCGLRRVARVGRAGRSHGSGRSAHGDLSWPDCRRSGSCTRNERRNRDDDDGRKACDCGKGTMKPFRELVFPLVAIAAAFVVGGIVVTLIGDDPVDTYRLLIGSALSWPDGIGYTLFYATPLIFTGLAGAVGFPFGLLNIGAEGQLTIAAFATAWAGITFAHASAWILIPLTCGIAILSGAAWAAIPGVLKARFGSHEVINTIMMNFIAAGVASALTQSYF